MTLGNKLYLTQQSDLFNLKRNIQFHFFHLEQQNVLNISMCKGETEHFTVEQYTQCHFLNHVQVDPDEMCSVNHASYLHIKYTSL